jgi:hypothetical protein
MDSGSVRKQEGPRGEPVTAPGRLEGRICLVCAEPAEDLICTACRARIRGEALERRREENRRVPA